MDVNQIVSGKNQAEYQYDYSRLEISDIETQRKDYENISGALETVVKGTVMGIVAGTQKLVPCKSTAIDGSQIPVRILLDSLEDIAIAGTVDQLLTAQGGIFRRDKIVFQNGTDTLATTATDAGGVVKTMEDWLTQNMTSITRFDPVSDNSQYQ
jgi:hypothetical protein